MNTHRGGKAVAVALFFSAALFGAAAGGTAQDSSVPPADTAQDERLVATVQSVQDDLKLALMQSEATEEALNELLVTDVADLEQAYQEFSIAVARMQDTGNRLVTHADELRYGGPSYLVESGQTPTACVFPRLRVPQDSKQAQLGEHFDAVAAEAWKVKRAYRAFQFDISQINEVLYQNLTPRTLDTLRNIINKARVDGDSLQEALTRAQAVLERAKLASRNAGQVPS